MKLQSGFFLLLATTLIACTSPTGELVEPPATPLVDVSLANESRLDPEPPHPGNPTSTPSASPDPSSFPDHSDEPTPGSATSAGRPAELEPFVLPGYAVLGFERGDLNRDERKTDVVLVLRRVDEQEEEPRPVLLLVRREDGGLQLAGRDDAVVLCVACGGVYGDPWSGITIKDGYFSVEHYGGSAWRWTHVVTFRWDGSGGWTLHKVGGDSFHVVEPEKVQTTVKTKADFGEVPFGQYAAAGL